MNFVFENYVKIVINVHNVIKTGDTEISNKLPINN